MNTDTDKLIAQARELADWREDSGYGPPSELLRALAAALEAAEARLREAELPSSEDVQMVFRLAKMTERAEAAEAQRDTLAKALREINWRGSTRPYPATSAQLVGIARAALAEVRP